MDLTRVSNILSRKLENKNLLVMPSFFKHKQEFTQEETQMTYGTAKVRIHVERIIQRLGKFRILDEIPR